MIEWMKTLPQDAEVECGVEKLRGFDIRMVHRPVDIECCEVYDFTSEEDRIRFPDRAGKTIVYIEGNEE